MKLLQKPYFIAFIVSLIFIFGLILRFSFLSSVPNGLYPDETALGYNAFSILHSGKDEYGASYPLYFRSFDDYKLPVYVYSTAIAMNFFGENAFSVRVMSALFGVLAIISLYFLIVLLSKNKILAASIAFFLAVNPWHSFFSRAGYEVNVATSFITIGMLFFVWAIQRKNSIPLFLISITMFLLSVYTYNVTRLIAPLILVSLVIFYFKKLTISSKFPLTLITAVFIIGMLPFLVSFIALQNEPGFASHKDALIIGNATKADILQTRSYFIDLPSVVQKIFFNYWVLVGMTYVKNVISFFSTSFYFIIGSEKPNQNITGMAMFYYFEFPLILFGLYSTLKKKATFLYPFLIWLLVVLLFGSLVKIVPNGTRTYPVVIPLTVLSGYGFYLLAAHFHKLKIKGIRYALFGAIIWFMGYSYGYYFLSYFHRYPIEHASDWRSEDQKTVEYIRGLENKYDKVVFDESSEFFYTSLAFYGKYNPSEFQKTAQYELKGLVNGVTSVGKYEFKKIDWTKNPPEPNTLYIVGPKNIPENITILREFDYPKRPLVLYYDRKIGQLSVTDKAYILFEKSQ